MNRSLLCCFTLAIFLLLGHATAVAQTPTPTPRFGLIETYEDPAAAAVTGAGWTRVRFQWAEAQLGGPETWTPAITDDVIDAELAAGREVVGLLIGIPAWANDDGVPRGLDLPFDHPDNSWGVFVRDTAVRYAGRIDRWIIWNEPDIDDPTTPGHTWNGTIEQFVQLHKVAYLAARDGNPAARIHLAAFTYFWDPGYFPRFLDLLVADPDAAAHDHYFDVATAHLYFQPNSIYNIIAEMKAEMALRGLDKPLWLVETNAPPFDDPLWPVANWTLAVDRQEQAAFISQAFAAALAAGAERVAIFKLRDSATDRLANPEPFGLIRDDGSQRPAFVAYRVAVDFFAGVTAAHRVEWGEVARIDLIHDDGRVTSILFNRLPWSRSVTVPVVDENARLFDHWGTRRTLARDGDAYVLQFPVARCNQSIGDYCMIGSTTYFLVQQDAAATLAPAPTAVPPTSTPTPSPTATPLPTPTPTMQPSATLPPTSLPATAVPTLTNPPPTASPQALALVTANPLPPAIATPTSPPLPLYLLLLIPAVLIGALIIRRLRKNA